MKRLRVSMTTGSITVEETNPGLPSIGGRGLTSWIVNRQVPPGCDPLGPDNLLVIAVGILTGTPLVNTSRVSLGGKSPLTGGIKESNTGGTIAAVLGKLGISSIEISGKPKTMKASILVIDSEGEAALHHADELVGCGTYETVGILKSRWGNKVSVLCTGPAGDRGMLSASVQSSDTDGNPCRAAGRGGLGAVMGSKGLKAVVVADVKKRRVPLPSETEFKALAREYAGILLHHPLTSKVLPSYGTAASVSTINNAGAFPCFNAREGVFPEWKKISGESLAELCKARGGMTGHMGCSQCVIRCSNVFRDVTGRYVTGSLEYETLWSVGAMCGISDLDIIARLDYLCDDLGLDTINTGVGAAVALDAGYAAFGDGDAVLRLLEETRAGSELGKAMGDGPDAVGRYFGHNRIPTVKGQAISAYDPRVLPGMAVTYASSPMGADHTAGYVVVDNLSEKDNPAGPEAQVALSRRAQYRTAFMDATGLCSFATSAVKRDPRGEKLIVDMVNLRCGTGLGAEDIYSVGKEIIDLELDFNRRAGLTPKDDRLPEMFYTEPLPPNNMTVTLPDHELEGIFAEGRAGAGAER